MSDYNEATRVQMPAMVHLARLGYEYIGKISNNMAGKFYDGQTNILIEIFASQFQKLNPKNKQFSQVFNEIKNALASDDLGKSFYRILISQSPFKLIDFDNPDNNTFHYTAEFTCKNGEDEFRPDITLFVNGLPLVFIETKKPNNNGGMLAESKRMNDIRFPNKKFRSFLNITQLMIFSNNMEYDAKGGIVPIEGAFYCTNAEKQAAFNCFREENEEFYTTFPYKDFSEIASQEKKILFDYNCSVIKNAPEYKSNLNELTPTNRIITSMCSKNRLLFILRYAFAYINQTVQQDNAIKTIKEKHIMRYQQMFAALAVKNKVNQGVKSGIIWHTQGSGKTALSYYLSFLLKDELAKQSIVAKFYFIVDRLDLLTQAKEEFEARGLKVITVNSREEFMRHFESTQSQQGTSGEAEITVVNIQKFENDSEKITIKPYANNLQRVFFIDEAHRGYNPKGSFLNNLLNADTNAIKIALTGTPLLKEERESWKVFGNYIHTYYYDRSIEDGYTLKIIREDIKTSYREKLQQIYDELEVKITKKELTKKEIFEHSNYIKELLRFIIKDFYLFRHVQMFDDSLGGMIICQSSEQARKMYELFNVVQEEIFQNYPNEKRFVAKLILHDINKDEIKQTVDDFKNKYTVDILIVYNMLLTGFDAKRLKRLYFGRQIKDHNLLQALTRVNRRYKDIRHGFVIDFANIKEDFNQINQAYLKELNSYNDSEQIGEVINPPMFAQILEDKDFLIKQMQESRQILFDFTINNAEEFCTEISDIDDKQQLLELRKALVTAKECYNIVNTFGDEELKKTFAKLEIKKLPEMLGEINHRITIINQKEVFYSDHKQQINQMMNMIEFSFDKIAEEELKFIDGGVQFNDKWHQVINAFTSNVDKQDEEYITLHDAFIQRFKQWGFQPQSMEQYNEQMMYMDEVLEHLHKLAKTNNNLMNKYNGDEKFVRVHKRIKEENKRREQANKHILFGTFYDHEILAILNTIKSEIDQRVYDRSNILQQDAYFETTVTSEIAKRLEDFPQIQPEMEDYTFLSSQITKQYLQQYHNPTFQIV
ncbi:MAG: DEAD/DEAH box helicase family protein [Bacteroidales bacterium]|nr:DEAD/DEAH box helicase family protein [Bacteroidales bacterium]